MAGESVNNHGSRVITTGEIHQTDPVQRDRAKPSTPLQAPPTTRVSNAQTGRVQDTRKTGTSLLEARGSITRKKRGPVRQRRLKIPEVKALNRYERLAFEPAARELSSLAARLDSDPSAAAELSTKLGAVMKEARLSKSAQQHERLTQSGLDTLLGQVLASGKLSVQQAQGAQDRLMAMFHDGTSPEVIKEGIVAFDGMLQRLALVDARVEYPTDKNRARDLLLTYARALHR